ncbi:MAG: dTDP-4-amino-4,6-dideoxygalactose transaminase [Candidatus Fibromonas sp.]|jgi:dTDP-4-amino-4,6-dideoxygalactose transaminase|nr:dTDP-4-amino-4,6-dideoxygalactose transaminase [Candidatus Fibromonas sp.]
MSGCVNFNEAPFLGSEFEHIKDAIDSKHISGGGKYTKLCNAILEDITGAKKAMLTHSCTAALEMSALLLDIQQGDEVILPSYTFPSTASAFALRGVKLVFIDVKNDTLNLNENLLEQAITKKTKAIIPVHYAGVSCEMDGILDIASKYKIAVVEDAAQAVGSYYREKPCGSIGDLGCYSFHETKNISCGEGGALLINKDQYIEQAEIILEKGTDRSKFFRGQVDKYTWVGLGSSYLPSDMLAAYLYPQLQNVERINKHRIELWNNYHKNFEEFEKKGVVKRPFVPAHCKHNAHIYYLRFNSMEIRNKFIEYMNDNHITCIFHYVPLHSSPAGKKYGRVAGSMECTNNVAGTLARLPLFYGMDAQNRIIDCAGSFLSNL